MNRLKLFIPLVILLLLIPLFLPLLMDRERNPDILPSVLIGREFPQFSLQDLHDESRRYSREDIIGEPFLINVWATWCPSCRHEHAYLMKLANEGVNIYGLDYKDDRDKAKAWIRDLGNPYKLNFFDPQGELVLDLGVYGAPETYVISAEGEILYRHVGVVNDKVWHGKLKPLYTNSVGNEGVSAAEASTN